jgi:hypothetical protein
LTIIAKACSGMFNKEKKSFERGSVSRDFYNKIEIQIFVIQNKWLIHVVTKPSLE